MSAAAYKLLQSFVEVVTEKNLEGFLSRESNKRAVLIFTEKKSVHPLFKVLSKKFRTYFKFGIIKGAQEADNAGLVKKFGVKKYPQLVITD